MTDQELLEQYRRDGRIDTLGVLLSRYTHLIFGVCMKYLKNTEDARDHTQQICLKVLKEVPRHHISYFKSWLYQVTKNHCLMHLRKTRHIHVEPIHDQWPDEQENTEERLLAMEQQYDHLEKALGMLNTAQQTCIRLFYLNQKSYQEVSELTGYSMLQVKSHIQNGKRNLLRLINNMHDNP